MELQAPLAWLEWCWLCSAQWEELLNPSSAPQVAVSPPKTQSSCSRMLLSPEQSVVAAGYASGYSNASLALGTYLQLQAHLWCERWPRTSLQGAYFWLCQGKGRL